jgi:TolB-like protein
MMLSLPLAVVLAASSTDPIVAVLYFDNNSNDRELDVMRKGLADLVSTDLVAWDGVRVVERARLEDTLSELKLQQTKAFNAAARVRLGQLLGAQYLLSGAFYLKPPDKLLIDATLTRTGTAEKAPVSVRVEGSKDSIFELEQQLVEKLAQQIDLKLKDAKVRKRVKVSNLQALLTYSAGVDLADQGKFDEAEKAFAKTISASPSFLLARDKKEGLKAFIEQSRARRKDAITEAVLAVSARCDEGLKADFSKLDVSGASRFLLWRAVQARVLARRLKSELTPRRFVRRGREKQALELMRAWAANAEALVTETVEFATRFAEKLPNGQTYTQSPRVDERALATMLAESQLMSGIDFDSDPSRSLHAFVLQGRLSDGEDFSMAPALADFEPKRYDLLMAALRVSVETKPEAQAIDAAEMLAEVHLKLDQYDAAAAVLQQVMDRFPTCSRYEWLEKQLRSIADESSQSFDGRRRFALALKSCKIERGIDVVSEWEPRFGLQSMDRFVEQAETCAGAPWAQHVFEGLYSLAANFYRDQRDCERAAYFARKALGAGAWPETVESLTTRDGCDVSSLKLQPMPARVRVTLTSGGLNWADGDAFKAGLEALLSEEVGARGFNLETGGSSHGGTVNVYVAVERISGVLTLLGNRLARSPDVPELAHQSVVQKEQKGAFQLTAYVDLLLAQVSPGFLSGDRRKLGLVSTSTLVAVGQAVDLFEDRKYVEAEAAFATLRKTASIAAFAQRYERLAHVLAKGETVE